MLWHIEFAHKRCAQIHSHDAKKETLFLYYVTDISGFVKVSKGTNKSTDKFREEADTSVFHNQQSLNSCVSGTEG